MTTKQAKKHLRWVLNYYSVVHDAQCKGDGLEKCSCDTGRAWRHILKKLSPQES